MIMFHVNLQGCISNVSDVVFVEVGLLPTGIHIRVEKNTDRFPINKKFGNDILSQPLEGWRRCGRKGTHFRGSCFFITRCQLLIGGLGRLVVWDPRSPIH